MFTEALDVYEEIAEMDMEYIHDILDAYLAVRKKLTNFPGRLRACRNGLETMMESAC